jgi:hypothetical protein
MNKKTNDICIHIQRGLRVSKEDKRNNFTDKAFEISLKDLYKKIAVAKESSSYIEEYHEYILINSTSNMCKLFFDIDGDVVLNSDQLNIEIEKFKNEISDIIMNDIMLNQDYKICYMNSASKISKDIIIKNMYITKSNNDKKLSLHIFINNIIMESVIFKYIKNIFKHYKNLQSSCMLIKYIDLNVFKEEPLLRIPYSIKEKSEYWHMEYNFDLNSRNLYKILFSSYKIKNVICEIKKNNNFSLEKCNLKIETRSNLPHQSEFLGYKLYDNLLKVNSFFKLIKNSSDLQNLESVNTDYKFYLELYSEYKNFICICGKGKHKNKHYLLFKNDEIVLSKEGNAYNCVIYNFSYPMLDANQISNFIFKLDIFKKMEDGKFMYWNNILWQTVDNDDVIYNMTTRCSKYFNYVDREYLTGRYFNESKKRIKACLSTQKEKYCDNPYIIQFTNGVFDIKENIFIKNCKTYVCKHNLGFNYVNIQELTDTEKVKEMYYRNKLYELIDNIIPKYTDYRILFECNISTCLLNMNKPVINVLIGDTCSGKSTLRLLIATLLNNLYIDFPSGIYTSNVPEKHNPAPNPFLAQCGRKLCSFSSELDKDSKLRAVNIKRNTELHILARNLNENICEHVNTLTQVIDTNFIPFIDTDDPAVLRRLCFIKINYSYFVDNIDNVNESCIKSRKILKRDINLQYEIVSNLYRNAMFELLKDWVRKYHLKGLKLKINIDMEKQTNISNIKLDWNEINYIIENYAIKSKKIKSEYIKYDYKNNYGFKNINDGQIIIMKRYIYTKKKQNTYYNIYYDVINEENNNNNIFCYVMIDHIINIDVLQQLYEDTDFQTMLNDYDTYMDTIISKNSNNL